MHIHSNSSFGPRPARSVHIPRPLQQCGAAGQRRQRPQNPHLSSIQQATASAAVHWTTAKCRGSTSFGAELCDLLPCLWASHTIHEVAGPCQHAAWPTSVLYTTGATARRRLKHARSARVDYSMKQAPCDTVRVGDHVWRTVQARASGGRRDWRGRLTAASGAAQVRRPGRRPRAIPASLTASQSSIRAVVLVAEPWRHSSGLRVTPADAMHTSPGWTAAGTARACSRSRTVLLPATKAKQAPYQGWGRAVTWPALPEQSWAWVRAGRLLVTCFSPRFVACTWPCIRPFHPPDTCHLDLPYTAPASAARAPMKQKHRAAPGGRRGAWQGHNRAP